MERLLTAREVAVIARVTPATVLRWTREGHLPGVRLPSGQIRYVPEDIDGWLAARATPLRGDAATRSPDDNDAALAASQVGSEVRHDRPLRVVGQTTTEEA